MRSLAKILMILLTALLVFGCASRPKYGPSFGYEDLLRSALLDGQSIQNHHSARQSEFHPYLDRKWIGQAISYGCYRPGQAPGVKGPSKAEILEDLRIISEHWNLIRVYNADDDTQRILEVIQEYKLPIRMMLGIWLENETSRPEVRSQNVENVLHGIRLANSYGDIVIAISVGNETQVDWSWHRMVSEDLIRYIQTVKNHTTQPVTTADDYNFLNKPASQSLAVMLDFLTVHAYPLWNGLALDTAFPWLDKTLSAVRDIHPGKTIILGEIGWATDFDASKKGDGQQGTLVKGEVGIAAQERFLIDLDTWISANHIPCFLFEAFDEPWKGGGDASAANEIEKNWGVFHADRTPKPSFINYLSQQTELK